MNAKYHLGIQLVTGCKIGPYPPSRQKTPPSQFLSIVFGSTVDHLKQSSRILSHCVFFDVWRHNIYRICIKMQRNISLDKVVFIGGVRNIPFDRLITTYKFLGIQEKAMLRFDWVEVDEILHVIVASAPGTCCIKCLTSNEKEKIFACQNSCTP